MSSIIKVDQIQLADGSTPTAGDLGLNTDGTILNVWNMTWGGQTAVNTTTWTDTGLTLTVTPTSADSKFYISASIWGYIENSSVHGCFDVYSSAKGARLANSGYGMGNIRATSGNLQSQLVVAYTDSPNTISDITYTVQIMRTNADSGNFYAGASSRVSAYQILEIAG